MAHQTLTDIAADLASGRTDPVRLVEEALDKARAAPAVFITLMAEEALAEACAAAARRRNGKALGPLDGIPIAWKDLFDIAGTRTTAGSRTRDDAPMAREDAPVVAASRRVGLIPLGKTNLSEFAFSGLGPNPHFGTPTPDFPGVAPRVPGGSSSGSAVAVQRGIVPVGIGTDTAGSVRVPAALNGLVGFKASGGRYAMAGVYPLAKSLDSLGPIARTVADCVTIDAVMRGTGRVAEAASAAPDIVVDPAVLEEDGLEDAVRANFEAMLAGLEASGARVRRAPVAAWREARRAIAEIGWLGAVEARAWHLDAISGPKRDLIDARVLKRLDGAAAITAEAAGRLRSLKATLSRSIADDLAGALFALPTVKHVAPELASLEADPELFARINLATLTLTMAGSFLDMPGLALPSGTNAEGLPTSALFSLPSGDDDALLAAGLWIEHAIARH
ncbi:glutamyl-tRNA amidotransferase [Chelatococcus daeguensis]|uniref:Glutamyl-tRNA amidotransferase n=1 Tax=Chelatococcus daeguensis TaxID=444444 RepID=A0AAC9JR08_9HYPH|nr:amidase family protein [Chelatococcus daeguensis]APF36774.1 glutamyl-tRNA amidotransferase [Chelatococcus daeguensis]